MIVATTRLLFLGLLLPAALQSQHRAPAAYHRSTPDLVTVSLPGTASSHRPSRVPYIVGGAVVGGVTAGVLAYEDVKNSDAILGEIGVAIAALAGAAVGALVGWAVYEIRH